MTSFRQALAVSSTALLALASQYQPCVAFTSRYHGNRKLHHSCHNGLGSQISGSSIEESAEQGSEDDDSTRSCPPKASLSRRDLLISASLAAAFIPLSTLAISDSERKSLQDLELGQGKWTKVRSASTTTLSPDFVVPATFATYAARFLINYDNGVASWWRELKRSYSLMPDDQQHDRLLASFGSYATSVQLALDNFIQQAGTTSEGYARLARVLLDKYSRREGARRHIGILFAMLPADQQPMDTLRELAGGRPRSESADSDALTSLSIDINVPNPPPAILKEDLSSLLPQEYHCAQVAGGSMFSVFPLISFYEGVDEEFGQTAIATAFGPLSSAALTREKPDYSLDIYALFGISGAAGCAVTHSLVIPLDVVKTRAQTDPGEYQNMFDGARRIVEEEGVQGLFTGAQATLAGYFWYGLSVYPSYTFFKRFMGQSLLPPEIAAVHANDIALIAGALAAVIASLGLTPLEAARIRVVAEPERYKPLGLIGTMQVIASEDPQLGWKTVYAGLPSLMTRQVIFGSVKFLAFERACEAIYFAWPFLHEATWTALGVTLVAGGFSGSLSSVVSQPADSVLTYVARNSSGKGSLGAIEGCRMMVREGGVGSLFRGLGSRCVWAGSIIAGQFLLYDIFRNYFGVSGQDLSQVFQIVIPGPP